MLGGRGSPCLPNGMHLSFIFHRGETHGFFLFGRGKDPFPGTYRMHDSKICVERLSMDNIKFR
jgi:hypothetical protein